MKKVIDTILKIANWCESTKMVAFILSCLYIVSLSVIGFAFYRGDAAQGIFASLAWIFAVLPSLMRCLSNLLDIK